MDFDDFILDVTAVSGGDESAPAAFRARVLSSPAGATGPEPVTLPTREWRRQAATLFGAGPPPPGEHPADRLRDAGHTLAEGLFRGRILSRWAESAERSRARGRTLRLCLRLPVDGGRAGDPHRVPWEALRLERSEAALVLSPGGYLVRQLTVGGGERPAPRPGRLRVLAVTAGDLPELPALAFAAEIAGLQAALANEPGVDLAVEKGVGLRRLAELLEETGCHVLHVMAHGGFPAAARGGCLYLPDERGCAERVDGERFAGVVHEAAAPGGEAGAGLRLVFLNACRTAQVTEAAPFTAVATALVAQAKVPAVIAMQLPIADAAAVGFAEEVYRRLAGGHSVDEAVRLGRKRLARHHGPAWAVPVLFSSLGSGRLFAEPPPMPLRRMLGVVALGLLLGALALWLGVAYLGPPRLASPPPVTEPEGERSDSLLLVDGVVLPLPQLGATLRADFVEGADPGAVVTMAIGGEAHHQLVVNTGEFDFEVAGRRYLLEVVDVDEEERRLRARPPRPWTPP